jgi:hypothetical protein
MSRGQTFSARIIYFNVAHTIKELFTGRFENDMRTGRGVYTWPNGDRYEGRFENGTRTGRGVYTWLSGDRYEMSCS